MSKTVVRGSELTKKLLEKQKYVLCKVSRYSDERARTFKDVRTIYSTFNGGFMCEDGDIVKYAVPIDMNGNEIVEKAMSKTVLKGSELTKKLLENQKYVLCYCSDTKDDDCRKYKNMRVVTCFEDGYFYTGRVDDPFVNTWKHAVPIDNNGNELVGTEEASLSEMSYGLWKKV